MAPCLYQSLYWTAFVTSKVSIRKVSYSLLNNVKDSPLLSPGKLTPHCSALKGNMAVTEFKNTSFIATVNTNPPYVYCIGLFRPLLCYCHSCAIANKRFTCLNKVDDEKTSGRQNHWPHQEEMEERNNFDHFCRVGEGAILPNWLCNIFRTAGKWVTCNEEKKQQRHILRTPSSGVFSYFLLYLSLTDQESQVTSRFTSQ